MTKHLRNVLNSLGKGRNVLLYGPPATGKTRLISQLFEYLGGNSADELKSRKIVMDPDNIEIPFSYPPSEATIPLPAKVVWTTFHQSYGYEDFVLGLRPVMSENYTSLQPWAGVFLDSALELSDEQSPYKSVVIFIDELNRGNAARIFGEFMTFLDFDYREGGTFPLPLPLRQISYEQGLSEDILRQGGKVTRIPEGFTFPRDIYIVATMNSVDRAAIPIDSALARRFDRIEMRPDPNVLYENWNLESSRFQPNDVTSWERLSAFETALLLLERLNMEISSDLGSEFELGHGLLLGLQRFYVEEGSKVREVEDEEAWRTLAAIWDDVLWPQLEDRYSGRSEHLVKLLMVEEPPPEGSYAWTFRTSRGGRVLSRAVEPVHLSELNLDTIRRSLRWLTRA
ncbi:MAG TPA: hypothetical protein DIS84_03570 [Corynebacterium stationis]|nr:hypothetical protein [Corynebacterium stationis]